MLVTTEQKRSLKPSFLKEKSGKTPFSIRVKLLKSCVQQEVVEFEYNAHFALNKNIHVWMN